MSIAKRIREERERLGYTRDDWANHVGVHLNTQLKYERGDSEPDIGYLAKIEELGADYSYIVTGEKAVFVSQAEALNRECAIIYNVIDSLESALVKSGKTLSSQKKARAASMLFRMAFPNGIVSEKMVEDIISLAET